MPKPNNWSDAEVTAAVADDFHMLRLELAGDPYNKAAHRRALQARLDRRSEGAVELKHQNISAVLMQSGILNRRCAMRRGWARPPPAWLARRAQPATGASA